MIPISINLRDGVFNFIVLGEGLLELLYEPEQPVLFAFGKLHFKSLQALTIKLTTVPHRVAFDPAQVWVHGEVSFQDAASLIEWSRWNNARGNWEPAPNKSSALLDLYGKQIITPDRLQQEWNKVKR